MNKKYELTKETTIAWTGETLFRLKALVNIGLSIKKGDLGGFIKCETNLETTGKAWVYGNARVYGNAWVCGNAQVYGDAYIQFGRLQVEIFSNIQAYIASSLDAYPIKGFYYLYKRVVKVSNSKYKACYDGKTIYEDGKVTRIEDFDPDIKVSCSRGIHASTPFYYTQGDTLIAVKVKVSDIITCQEGKVRCKAVTTIGEIKV